MFTIKELLTLTAGSPVPEARGIVRSLGKYTRGTLENAEYSLQEMFIEDETGSIAVKIGNKPEIADEYAAQHWPIYFVARTKPNGGLIGLRIDEGTYEEEGQTKKQKFLAVGRAADVLSEREYAARTGSALPAKAAKPPIAESAPVQSSAPAAPAPAPAPGKPAGLRVTELRYERVVNTGNYCSERLGLTLALEPETKASDALAAAKTFVEKNLPKEVVPQGRELK